MTTLLKNKPRAAEIIRLSEAQSGLGAVLAATELR